VANPVGSDAPHWQAALEHYHWDRLEEAYREIFEHGIGEAGSYLRWYRLIEAEAITRRNSRVEQVTPWLTFEYIPDEVGPFRVELVEAMLRAADEVAVRLGWQHGQKTYLSILAEETDAPWATNPFGYCITKEPYEKICLPSYLIDDTEEFKQAVAHEYAHVISGTLSDNNAPRWLEEAVSVLAERRFDEPARQEFVQGIEPWLDPNELELMIEGSAEEEDEDSVWLAYQQAGWIGRYLVSLADEKKLGVLLREHADESLIRNLKLALTGRDRFDGALRAVYGMSARQLFDQTLKWLETQTGG
jgi:hypothetical protein